MPIDKSRYPANWSKVSLIIRRVAGNHCEYCHVENGSPLPSGRSGKVILTVAHIGAPLATGDTSDQWHGWKPGDKQNKHDIRRENLRALCQKCHLALDLEDHIQHAKATRARKKREQQQARGQLFLFDRV